MPPKSGSVDPSRFPDEIFDLYSVPAFDKGKPEVIAGRAIGSAKQIVKPGDVLLSKIVPHIRRCWVVRKNRGRRMIASSEWIVFRNDKICPNYLSRVLTANSFHARFMQTVSGVGGSLLRARPSYVAEIEIPFPRLSEQRRIAKLLDQADRLRRMRRYALGLSDTFLPAAFLQLFGDPDTNPHKWPTPYLGDVLLSAQDGPHVSPHYSTQGIPFLSTRNVRPGDIVWDDLKFISLEDAKEQWRKVKPARGDILYTKGGTTGMAKSVDFDRDIAVWVHIAVLKLKTDQVVPVWLEQMLNSQFCYKQSQDLTFGIVNRDLGLKRMPRIRIYLPPMSLQIEFARMVARANRVRAIQRESLRQAEHLFQTLLHRSFTEPL
jgi:type I restriction enzyme S subunit